MTANRSFNTTPPDQFNVRPLMSSKSALEIAEELFASYRGPGSEAARIGEAALQVLLQERTPEELSAAETHCLLKAYNWTFRHKDGLHLAKQAVQRWGDEFMRNVDTALHNACYWPKGAYMIAADELIREGIGSAIHWHLRKADWWVSEATGEHDSEQEWCPGDEIVDQAALDQAAIELDAAIRLAFPDLKLPEANWKERYAPILEQPRFARFCPDVDGASLKNTSSD
jgi:hypothetical protein